MNIHPGGAKLFHADRRMNGCDEVKSLLAALRNMPKNLYWFSKYPQELPVHDLEITVWSTVSAHRILQPMSSEENDKCIVTSCKQRFKANFSVTALGQVIGEWLITPWSVASKIYRSEPMQLLLVENPTKQKVFE
jgi:hypothetical protein